MTFHTAVSCIPSLVLGKSQAVMLCEVMDADTPERSVSKVSGSCRLGRYELLVRAKHLAV